MKIFNILKKLGFYSTMGLGLVVTVGCTTSSSLALVYEDKIKSTINDLAGTTQNTINGLLTSFDTIVSTVNTSKDEIVSDINSGSDLLNTQLQNLKNVKAKIDEYAQKHPQSKDSTEEISKQLYEIINQIEKTIVPEVNNIKDLVNQNINKVDGVLNGDMVNNVKDITNTANNVLDKIKDPNSPIWKYYGIISKAILIISAVILVVFVSGLVLKLLFYKRVDGVYIKKSSSKQELRMHVKKILKKYPQLYRVVDEM